MPQGITDTVATALPLAADVAAARKVLEEAELKVLKRTEVPQRLCLPIQLLDSIAFDRAKSWAKTNGEEYITLKANSEGILAL